MYSVGICGEAVTQLATDTVTKSHLVAGNTKQIKTSTFWSVWSLCGAAGRGEAAGSEGEAAVFHLLENQTESHWFSHDIPNPPKTHPSESDGWCGEHAHHLTWKKKPMLLKPGALPPTLAQRPPPLLLSLPGCLSLAPPVSFMPLQSSCCPENWGSSIHIWAH